MAECSIGKGDDSAAIGNFEVTSDHRCSRKHGGIRGLSTAGGKFDDVVVRICGRHGLEVNDGVVTIPFRECKSFTGEPTTEHVMACASSETILAAIALE